MTPADTGTAQRAMGNAHMQCGLALMHTGDPISVAAALRHFDRALELRRGLPCDDNLTAFALAASWMNRAEALLALGGTDQIVEAIAALSAAVALLETLPPDEDRRFPRRLAIALQNRALARARLGRDTWTMVPDLYTALDLLQAEDSADARHLVATVWVNIGIAQFIEPSADAWRRAIQSAQQAMQVADGREWTDVRMAEVGLRARYLCCQAAARLLGQHPDDAAALIQLAASASSTALAVAEVWQRRGVSAFATLADDVREFSRRLGAWPRPHAYRERGSKPSRPA